MTNTDQLAEEFAEAVEAENITFSEATRKIRRAIVENRSEK